ncbi:MAG: XcyI family restriction endonuclease [bacterium]|nr:XcyI family restriction endonuclease [bacterium]
MNHFNIPMPEQQVSFAHSLESIKSKFLGQALADAVEQSDLEVINNDLKLYAPANSLKTLASLGIRGEIVFPTPCILKHNPHLLAYYRLLLGYSQKAFYSAHYGLSGFKVLEDKGRLSSKLEAKLPPLCESLSQCSAFLLNNLQDQFSLKLVEELVLLTLGPQLRGGANVKKGEEGIQRVFELIKMIVADAIVDSSDKRIKIRNAANRMVLLEFAADPDIVVREPHAGGRNILAIEVKGGTDFSNIHNRLGEAEKSHQKAKQNGYIECWTIVNVDKTNLEMAKKESPTSNQFFVLSEITDPAHEEFHRFRNNLTSLTSIHSK